MNNNIEDKNLRTPRVFLVSGCAFASFCNRKKETGKKGNEFHVEGVRSFSIIGKIVRQCLSFTQWPSFLRLPSLPNEKRQYSIVVRCISGDREKKCKRGKTKGRVQTCGVEQSHRDERKKGDRKLVSVGAIVGRDGTGRNR